MGSQIQAGEGAFPSTSKGNGSCPKAGSPEARSGVLARVADRTRLGGTALRRTVPLAIVLGGLGCNQVLGIHEALNEDWDGASASASGASQNTATSGGASATPFGTRTPSTSNTSGASDIPPPTDAGTTSYAWAAWPMPNPPSTGLPNPQSYTASADGLVLDNVTGLTWQASVAGPPLAWSDALAYCGTLTLAGGGWRLPSRIELLSLVDYTQVPTIDAKNFPGTPMGAFWSGSLLAGNASYAWTVNFGFTVTPSYDYPLNAMYYARCVR
jgi:hypothetical protein